MRSGIWMSAWVTVNERGCDQLCSCRRRGRITDHACASGTHQHTHQPTYLPAQTTRVKAVNPAVVTGFYKGACQHLQSVDPGTPCLVGPRPYYNLNAFDKSILIPGNANVIYTFDYFQPDKYIGGPGHSSSVPTYPGTYKCGDLYKGWANEINCPHGAAAMTGFNASWHRTNLIRANKLQNSLSVVHRYSV